MTKINSLLLFLGIAHLVEGCTNFLVTPGASADSNTMIAYNADSGNLMGYLYHYAASKQEETDNVNNSTMRKVYNWDTGVYLGEIPEALETYNVVGNTNEHGLVIAETTFGGLPQLSEPAEDAIIDYGSLIWITLQRSKTARSAINTMSKLLNEYGYASEGESFSIADKSGEVFIMEVIGKGKYGKGAVWVAMKVPDGYVSGHSNQARIQTFPRDDPQHCLYSADVVNFAKEIGIYTSDPKDPKDLLFSFSDVYNPVSFMGARASEARTWSLFSAISDDPNFEKTYESYAQGKDLTKRMPLFIKPKQRLSMDDMTNLMSDHYEETALDFRADVGAGEYGAPYRPRPLVWKHDEKLYFNERAVGTQQTGWNFIAHIRLSMPAPVSSVLWFAVDDSSTSPRFPVYGCSTEVSSAYAGKGTQDGTPSPLLTFDLAKAFWVQNMVSNFVYSRWSLAYPILRQKITDIQHKFSQELKQLDHDIVVMLSDEEKEDDTMLSAVELATKFSVQAGDDLHKEWMDFYGQLFTQFRDFFNITPDPSDPICNCKVSEAGTPDAWQDKVVKETGCRYEVGGGDPVPDLASKRLRSSNDGETSKFPLHYGSLLDIL